MKFYDTQIYYISSVVFIFMAGEIIVCITGAAGQIAYSLYNILCSSDVFGTQTSMELRLIEVPAKIAQLKTIKLEI